MIKSIINSKIDEADAVLLSAPYEKTASFHKGTVDGPKKIIECLDTQIEFFDRRHKVEVIDFVKTAREELEDLPGLSPAEAVDKIKNSCAELLGQDKFVLLLGGEHSVSIGFFQALAEKYDPKEITILHIDAHCDLRQDDSDYSEHPSNLAHSTVMRHASELGYNIVSAGVRAYSKEECEYFSDPKNKVKVFEWTKDIIPTGEIINSIETKYLYISIDVDGFDPAYMPGTGTPVQGGLSWYYGLDLLERAIEKCELVGADIVEVSPLPDSPLTEYGAAQLVYNIIANKFRNLLR